ncbi:hypothetical protein ElyMa_002953100 [Elysia marginata]|uniref:Uncharacterized protein n=1 Tax=Elysia marginata TaxID=1093978 RepID=A0AAV4I6L1_9GAST|nr:hypothetical protein ElyMa_002953100 [Elysia marginata]
MGELGIDSVMSVNFRPSLGDIEKYIATQRKHEVFFKINLHCKTAAAILLKVKVSRSSSGRSSSAHSVASWFSDRPSAFGPRGQEFESCFRQVDVQALRKAISMHFLRLTHELKEYNYRH